MFRNLNRTCIAISIMLIGIISPVFAVDFSQVINQMKEDVFSMGDIFQGKAIVKNLYSKALKLAKDREVTATTASFANLKIYYTKCSNLTETDFINILYSSNFSFRETFDDILPEGTKSPTSDEISKSYKKMFQCKNISINPGEDEIATVNNEVNTQYYAGYTNAYALATLNQDNFGSDFFINGTLDDSAFDILYDINQVGKLLFEDFKESPEILFYAMPTVDTPSGQGGSDLSSLLDQSSYQLGGGGGSFPGTTGTPTSTSSVPNTAGGNQTAPSPSSSITQGPTASYTPEPTIPDVEGDDEVQNFITNTNVTPQSFPAGSALVLGNQCLAGGAADTGKVAPIVYSIEEPVIQDPEAYISGIVNFIENASLNDILNEALLEQFHLDMPLPTGGSTSDPGVADQIANNYAEQAFGDPAPGTCEYQCKSLPIVDQPKCELDCAGSCIEQCNDLSKSSQSSCKATYDATLSYCDTLSRAKKPLCKTNAALAKKRCGTSATASRALCVSDCTCFMIAGPNGLGWKGVEDMFKIKFCKVPVQKKTVSPGKTVYSIQAIFQEISDVLEGLRDSGQTTKFYKAKEFLDGNIRNNMADTFAFKLEIGRKPVFAQKSTTLKIKEESEKNKDLSSSLLGMNVADPTSDYYNKYLVASSPAKDKASMEEYTSLADISQKIQEFEEDKAPYAEISDTVMNSLRKTYTQGLHIDFVQNMIDFLKDNQLFRDNLYQTLLDINKMSLELVTKIENSD